MNSIQSKGLMLKLFKGKKQEVEDQVNTWLKEIDRSIVKTQLSTYEWGATVHIAIWYYE